MPADSSSDRRRELRVSPPPTVEAGSGRVPPSIDDIVDVDAEPTVLPSTTDEFADTWDGGSGRRGPVPLATAAGPVLAGRFRVGEVLGRGGAAVVHRATDARLERDIAVKILRDDRPASQHQFVAEARITGQLQHPNIVPVHELDRDPDGRPFLALKRVQGRTLRDVIRTAHDEGQVIDARPTAPRRRSDVIGPDDEGERARGRTAYDAPWTIHRLLEAFLKVCDAVSYAHSRGIIHRDIKPSNVMVGDHGEVLVMDWGLARRLDDDGERESGMAGTPGYLAPEQARPGSGRLDEGVDIFALGGVLYTILTDRIPFRGRTGDAMVAALMEYDLTPPSQRVPGRSVPRELDAIVMRAMARRRRDRYATVAALREDLERYLDDRFVSAARYGPLRRLVKWSRRHRAAMLGVTTTAVALLVGAAGMLLAEQQRLAERQTRLEAEAHESRLAAEQSRLRARQEETEARREEERLKSIEAERRGRQAELARLAEERKYDELLRQLVAPVDDYNGEIARFLAEVDALRRKTHMPVELIVSDMDAAQRRLWLGAYNTRYQEGTYQPQDYLFHTFLAHSLGDTARSGDLAREFLDSHPGNPDAWYLSGLLLSRREPEEAIGLFTRAIGMRERAVYLTSRGVAFCVQHRFDLALSDFERALELDPDQTIAWQRRAECLATMSRFDEAAASATRALELWPDRVSARAMRASFHVHRGDFGAAMADARRALENGDETGLAHWSMGWMLANVDHRSGDALPWLKRATELNPGSGQQWMDYGSALWQCGDGEAAIRAFRESVRCRPREVGMRLRLANALSGLGRIPEAESELDTCERLGGNPGNIAVARAHIRLREGKAADALPLAELAVEHLENGPEAFAAYSLRGRAHRMLGNTSQARMDLERALKLAPVSNQPDIRRELELLADE